MTRPPDRLTRDEAARRAEQVSDVSYRLGLEFEEQAKAFRGEVTISFAHHGGDTFVEFLGGTIDDIAINGHPVDPHWDGARIVLPGDLLEERNEVRIAYQRQYDRTGEGIHHFIDPRDGTEYLYTQFEPYGAHRLFPCFDQPDLKATYRLTVDAPAEWEVLSAAPQPAGEMIGGGRSRRIFDETVPFSTYLFSVVAGEFRGVQSTHGTLPLGLYARRSLLPHLEKDAGSLFETTRGAMDYFGDLFSEPYPFTKYDQVFVPEFNWGGMENVGNVTYTDNVIFRDPPTEDQLRRRVEYFTHELAHMWFGDLVTMRWWNDIWLNESFASYVGYLALVELGDDEAWDDFHFRMKAWAYREDQRPTTHRIANEVATTDETFLNFDGITYGKGASVLRQLVRTIGPEGFREGLRIYFRRHRFGNATLADFLAALQEGSGTDLVSWAARWLMTPSLNTLAATVESTGDTITRLQIRQTAPEEHPQLRPHHFDIALLDAAGDITSVPAVVEDVVETVPEAEGHAVPGFVYPNFNDHGYFKVTLDERSLAYALEHLAEIEDGLLRQQVWGTVDDMVRDAAYSSLDYLALVDAQLPGEESIPTLQQMTRSVATAIARFVPEDEIDAAASRFVATARGAIDAENDGDRKVLWARALVAVASSDDDVRAAAALIDSPPPGLAVDQDLRWAVAIRFASLGLPGARERIDAEYERDPTNRGENCVVAATASAPDAGIKQEVWERIYGDGYESLTKMRSAAGGFWRRRQRDLLDGFVDQYFERLPEVFAEREFEVAKAFIISFFPRYRVDDATRTALAGLLARDDLGPGLRRLLVEADDDLRRALACRRRAAEGA